MLIRYWSVMEIGAVAISGVVPAAFLIAASSSAPALNVPGEPGAGAGGAGGASAAVAACMKAANKRVSIMELQSRPNAVGGEVISFAAMVEKDRAQRLWRLRKLHDYVDAEI